MFERQISTDKWAKWFYYSVHWVVPAILGNPVGKMTIKDCIQRLICHEVEACKYKQILYMYSPKYPHEKIHMEWVNGGSACDFITGSVLPAPLFWTSNLKHTQELHCVLYTEYRSKHTMFLFRLLFKEYFLNWTISNCLCVHVDLHVGYKCWVWMLCNDHREKLLLQYL